VSPLETIRNPAAHVADIPSARCIDMVAIITPLLSADVCPQMSA